MVLSFDAAGPRLLTPSDVRDLARRLDLRPSKRLGQNFVVDPSAIRRIVAAARLAPGQRVVEVGAGLGCLTLGLLEAGASVLAIEVDPRLASALPGTLAAFSASYMPDAVPSLPGAASFRSAGPGLRPFELVVADALEVEELGQPAPSALVANLPYSVATRLLLRFLERFGSIQRGLVMVQAEVAERLVAPPASKAYGVPSAKLAWWAKARLAGRVARNAFFPVPRVDSQLVYFERRPPPASQVPRDKVFALVDAAFGARRKMLRRALAPPAGGADRAAAALRAAGLDPTARGETLGIADFARLARHLEAL